MTTGETYPEDFYSRVSEGCALLAHGKTDAALEIIDALQAEFTEAPEVIYMVALFAATLDEFGRSLILMEEAHRLDPDCMEYADALANLHTRIGNLTEGLYYAKLSTALAPHPHASNLLPSSVSNYFEALQQTTLPRNHLYGLVRLNQHSYEKAATELSRQLQLDPNHIASNRDYSAALMAMGQYQKAIIHSRKAVEADPEDIKNHFQAGRLCQAIGAVEAAKYHLEKSIELGEDDYSLTVAAFSRMVEMPGMDSAEIAAAAGRVAERSAALPGLPKEAHPSDVRKEHIHVAYVANDLHHPDFAAFLEPLLRLHNRNKFEVYLYQQTTGQHAHMQQLTTLADYSRKLWELDDETAAVICAGDEIDILVDTTSAEYDNRAGFFAISPALIQTALFGTGRGLAKPGITHLFRDPAIKDAMAEYAGDDQIFSEISSGTISVSPSQILPNVSPLPAETNGFITFGAIFDMAALTPEAIEVFSQVLEAIPNSRLVFGASRDQDDYPAQRLAAAFEASGHAERISIWNRNSELDKIALDNAFWANVDLLLLPGPLYSPLRACEGLWLGVPVITLAGDGFASCIGTSILRAAAKPEWALRSRDDFVRQVAAMAADIPELAKQRTELRGALSQTALFNPSVFVRALEDHFTAFVEARDSAVATAGD